METWLGKFKRYVMRELYFDIDVKKMTKKGGKMTKVYTGEDGVKYTDYNNIAGKHGCFFRFEGGTKIVVVNY